MYGNPDLEEYNKILLFRNCNRQGCFFTERVYYTYRHGFYLKKLSQIWCGEINNYVFRVKIVWCKGNF